MTAKYGVLSELIAQINEITDTDEFDMDFFPPASTEQIEEFEKKHNLVLPEQYKQFLYFSDGCCLFNSDVQFYGVAHKPFIRTDFDGVDEGYFIIGKTGYGDPICFTSNSGEKIIQYGESFIEYSDFKEFLNYVVQIAIEDLDL